MVLWVAVQRDLSLLTHDSYFLFKCLSASVYLFPSTKWIRIHLTHLRTLFCKQVSLAFSLFLLGVYVF